MEKILEYALREAVFSALKGGRNTIFSWWNVDHSMILLKLRRVYIKAEIKNNDKTGMTELQTKIVQDDYMKITIRWRRNDTFDKRGCKFRGF